MGKMVISNGVTASSHLPSSLDLTSPFYHRFRRTMVWGNDLGKLFISQTNKNTILYNHTTTESWSMHFN